MGQDLAERRLRALSQVYPQQSDDEQGAVYDPNDIAVAGVRLTLNYEGELQVEPSDRSRWKPRAYTGVLVGVVTSGQTSNVDLSPLPAVGELLVADPDGASQSSGLSRVTALGSSVVGMSNGFGYPRRLFVRKGSPSLNMIHQWCFRRYRPLILVERNLAIVMFTAQL